MVCIGYVSFISKFIQELPQSVKQFVSRSGWKKLFSLILTQTVCKGYQQMTEVSKVFHMSMKVLCIGSHYMLKLCFNVRPSEYDQKIHIHML